MDINGLNLLMNTKKIKTNNIKTQFEEESSENDEYNSYNKFSNDLYNNNESNNSDTNSELEKIEKIEVEQTIKKNENIDREFNEIMQCLSKVDNYILDNNFNNKIEKINNYLIDLIYLIKTKKN